jgi:hypothetical protein
MKNQGKLIFESFFPSTKLSGFSKGLQFPLSFSNEIFWELGVEGEHQPTSCHCSVGNK